MPTSGVNAQQIEFWNEQGGPRWVEHQERIDPLLAPFGLRAMERAGIRPGQRVIDVGCGCGHTTLELARRVSDSGEVLGVDVSGVMLERARERARESAARNASFLRADAQTHGFEADSFDLLFSRFGIMFFADPVAAFANLRRALRRSGGLAFVCLQALARSPYMWIPFSAAAKHLEIPPPPPADAPGPFAFADPERVRRILEGAGFADVAIEPFEAELCVGGGDLDSAVQVLLGVGPTARLLLEADPERRALVASAVRDAIAPYATPEGVRMRGAVWIVHARRGA
jgi:SAM-dependent methyltransferase